MPAVKKQKLSTSTTRKLNKIYFNASHPASFGGIERLAQTAQLPVPKVQQFLSQQWTYQFHKPIRQTFQRRKYMVRGLDSQWQADLIEMQHYKAQNNGYRYILCVIDVFSRYAFAQPLKDKTGAEVATALERIFQTSGRIPNYLQTDLGKEFYNSAVQSLLSNYNVELFSVYSEKKAAIVERFQRTLKERMYRAFTHHGHHRWVELLPELISSYNQAYHHGLKGIPARVNKSNESDIWLKQYASVQTHASPKFQVGDRVRIPKQRTPFSKGYEEKWTDEIFTISAVNTKYKPALYTLVDEEGETIQGSFYEQELQRVENPDKLYRIEKVIRQRMLPNKKKEVLVQWKGYKTPTWIDASQLQSIHQ